MSRIGVYEECSIEYLELVPSGHAINATLYCEQLRRVYETLKEKYSTLIRQKLVLLQEDNAKPYTAKKNKEKSVDKLKRVEDIPHPPYITEAAPSDYGLAWTPF